MSSDFDALMDEADGLIMETFGSSAVFWAAGLDSAKDPPSGECQVDLVENYQAMDNEGYPRVITVIDLPDLLFGGIKPERNLKVKVSNRVYRLLQVVKRDKGLETWEVV
ncbi:MAG: hypothetical protein CMH98_04695 [Oceanospirillaceae bacterium]|nr:hypothetical protein [Oceanospirillaceae bacterium]